MPTFFRRLFALPSRLLGFPLSLLPRPSPPKQSPFPCAMDITNATFPQELIKIIQHIADSQFISFDLEFSGVAGRRPGGGSGKLSLQEYYQDLRSAAQIYQILQIGLTVVTEDVEKGRYVARPYNFNLSPLPATKEQVFRRVWSYNSGAISFLMRNGFNVERPLTQGVHYLSRQEEDEVRKKLIEDDRARSKIPDMTLKDDDSVLVEHIKQRVNEWQSLPKDEQEDYLNIPAEDAKDPIPSLLNRYQVRLTHQTVRNEYPKLKTQGMGHFVQITNPTAEQQANEKEVREDMREREVAHAVGFRWLLEAIMGGDLSKLPHFYVKAAFPEEKAPADIQGYLDSLQTQLKSRPRIFVGHNCLTDVINLYRCFIGDLPERVDDFKAGLHELFPFILDTKYVAGIGSKRWADTSLQSVESDLSSVEVPRIHLPQGFDHYLHAANYHEAGFDSFVTGKIGLKLIGKLKREGKEIKTLTERSDTAVVEEKSPAQSGGGQRHLKTSVVEVLTAPLYAAKSILTGSDNSTQQLAGSATAADPTESTVVTSSKREGQQAQGLSGERKKVKTVSQKSNIFNMLEDGPPEVSEEPDADEEEAENQRRIAEMVKKGELLPRWEEDADFWKLVSNKLQANACEEGVLDISQSAKA
ncbi:poly(A)-specific ribonuclease [Exophiala viscosa]|uniref:Poly(A)-specific ribonuclease n=1 Tax=Exophiala viscosa TaxID=2486360 RepID=A0AAN6DNH6_9EURO|nr:poly(A)-specific ribonuclease [Exophiala viscosa]